MSNSLVSKIKDKDIFSLSKAVTIVENRLSDYKDILSKAYSLRKNVQKVGITGPPGAGKSTITNKLCKRYLAQGKSVCVICFDPSSPFNGGAILGDRIRMKDVDMSDKVFIRSIATRGSTGGLSECVSDIDILFECFGFDVILYETVGVGQIELDVMNYCDSVILVLTPESGDDIQMMKAGLIECANIIAINKSDRPGSDRIKTFLKQYLDMGLEKESVPSVINLIAIEESGMELLGSKIQEHYSSVLKNKIKLNRDRQRYREFIFNITSNYLLENFLDKDRLLIVEKEVAKANSDRLSPYELLEKIK